MLACGRFEHQKSKCSLFKIKALRKFQGKYSQEVEPKILAENATGYYNLYKLAQCSNVPTTPLRQWGFWQCLPFSWTTLRGKHCRHLIAVMGVVDAFGQ